MSSRPVMVRPGSDIGRFVPKLDLEEPLGIISTDARVTKVGVGSEPALASFNSERACFNIDAIPNRAL